MIDFATLYGHPVSKPCVLWEQCDGHCCTIGRLLQPFDPTTQLAVLPIPAPEYEYLRRIGAPGDQWPDAPRVLELRLSGYSLTLYMQPCNLRGACNSDWRPAICRIYPYVPLIDDDFRVRAVMKATALDLIWDATGTEDPCVMRSPEEGKRHLEAMDDLVDRLKRHSDNFELFLWFNLAFRYVEAFKGYLEQSFPGDATVPMQESFRNLYLCNKTQLFLSDPAFTEKIDGEVERFHRWSRR